MATSEVVNLTAVERDPTFVDRLTPAGKLLRRCIQCGTCTASCPSAPAMDLTPRQMWRLAQLGFQDQVLHSKAMWLCSLCYICHVRCPRGIPLTETIVKLKQLALQEGIVEWPESTAFYRAFSDVMRRYGRMRELEFMFRYFLATNPLAALDYAGLGLTLLRRGKVHLEAPRLGGEGRLDRLFERVAELEGQQ
ncbi:MAG: 4Fe-4S dicluster domain-containing protein [Anaerolineae bacterium]